MYTLFKGTVLSRSDNTGSGMNIIDNLGDAPPCKGLDSSVGRPPVPLIQKSLVQILHQSGFVWGFVLKKSSNIFHFRWRKTADGMKSEDNGLMVLEFIAIQRKDNQQWAIPGVCRVPIWVHSWVMGVAGAGLTLRYRGKTTNSGPYQGCVGYLHGSIHGSWVWQGRG